MHLESLRVPTRRGFTTMELLTVLFLLSGILGIALPPLGRWQAEAAVDAAREELAGALAWTRMAAVSHSGATLILHAPTGRFWTETAAGPLAAPVDLAARYRVRVDAGGSPTASFHYDGLGIGRLASRTITFRRRGAEARLIVSAYGRFRRW